MPVPADVSEEDYATFEARLVQIASIMRNLSQEEVGFAWDIPCISRMLLFCSDVLPALCISAEPAAAYAEQARAPLSSAMVGAALCWSVLAPCCTSRP